MSLIVPLASVPQTLASPVWLVWLHKVKIFKVRMEVVGKHTNLPLLNRRFDLLRGFYLLEVEVKSAALTSSYLTYSESTFFSIILSFLASGLIPFSKSRRYFSISAVLSGGHISSLNSFRSGWLCRRTSRYKSLIHSCVCWKLFKRVIRMESTGVHGS